MSLSEHEAEFLPGKHERQPPPPPRDEPSGQFVKAKPEPAADPVDDPDLGEDAKAKHEQALAEAADPGLRFHEKANPVEKPERHRAQSQKAGADDVPTIKALTKELREAEEQLAKVKPSTSADSPRVIALKRQIRGIKADLEEAQPRPAQPVKAADAVRPVVREEPSTKPAETFTDPKPDYATFQADPAKYPDPYLAYTLAMGRWERKQEAFEAKQEAVKAAAAAARQKAEADAKTAVETVRKGYASRAKAFAETHPDYEARIAKVKADGYDIPPIVTKIVLEDDNGPELLYALTQHPEVLDDLLLNFGSVNHADDRTIVAMRRRLGKLVALDAAGTTGAAREPQRRPAPKPPTPVRTGPLKTGTEPPDDGASLASHEAQFNRPRRR